MKTTILNTQQKNINISIIIFPETLKYCTTEQNCRWIKVVQSLHQNSVQINQICNQNVSRKIKRKIFSFCSLVQQLPRPKLASAHDTLRSSSSRACAPVVAHLAQSRAHAAAPRA
jgi:hypothetical protein